MLKKSITWLIGICNRPKVLITGGIGIASFGQLALIKVGYSNLSVPDYGSFLRSINLYTVITLIFGSPAMTLGVLGDIRKNTDFETSSLLFYLTKLGILLCLAIAIYLYFSNQRPMSIVFFFLAISIATTSTYSVQRGILASDGMWMSIFALLALDGGIKLVLLIALNSYFDSQSQLGYLALLLTPQIIAMLLFTRVFNPIPLYLEPIRRPRGSITAIKKLTGIWMMGIGSVFATAIPVYYVTKNQIMNSNDIKTLGTCLFIYRAPISFFSALLTPFAAEESKRYKQFGQSDVLDRAIEYLKTNCFKLLMYLSSFIIVSSMILTTLFKLETEKIAVFGVMIAISTIFYYLGELMSTFMLTQGLVLFTIPGWLASSVVLVVLLRNYQDNPEQICVVLVIAPVVLLLLQILMLKIEKALRLNSVAT
jgi:hypothetical protein